MHFSVPSDYFRIAEVLKSITIKFIILLKAIDEAIILRMYKIFIFITNLLISPITLPLSEFIRIKDMKRISIYRRQFLHSQTN